MIFDRIDSAASLEKYQASKLTFENYIDLRTVGNCLRLPLVLEARVNNSQFPNISFSSSYQFDA